MMLRTAYHWELFNLEALDSWWSHIGGYAYPATIPMRRNSRPQEPIDADKNISGNLPWKIAAIPTECCWPFCNEKVQAVGSTWRNGFGRCFFLSGKCNFPICLSSQELAYCGSLMDFAYAICIHMHHTAVFRIESKSPLVASKTFQSSKHRLHGCFKAFPVTHPVDSQPSSRWKPTLAAETPGTIAWEKVFRKPLRCGFRFPGIKLPWEWFLPWKCCWGWIMKLGLYGFTTLQ
jgi:hypothetical protein